MKESEFDKRFDEGRNVLDQIDMKRMRRPDLDHKRIQLTLPVWLVNALDREARRLGVTRQSVIKMWLAEQLDQQAQ